MEKRASRLAKSDLGATAIRQPIALPSGNSTNSRESLDNIGWQQAHLHDAEDHWRCYQKNGWVRACVDLIAQAATADKYSINAPDETRRAALERVLQEIAPRTTFDRLLRTVYRDLQINGNCYIRVRFKGKLPVALHRVDFRQIVPDIPPRGSTEIKTYAIFAGGDTNLEPDRVQAREIIHLTLNDHGENGTGLSPLESLDDSLALATYAGKFQKGFFKNGVKAGDVYGTDGSMDSETYDRDKQYLLAQYAKPDQAYAPLFLSGPWKLVARGQDLRKDADFLQLLIWILQEVASVYSVPLSLLSVIAMGALGATGKEQDLRTFLNYNVGPLQKQVIEDFNQQLLVDCLRNTTTRLIPPGRSSLKLEDVQAAQLMTHLGASLNQVLAALNLPSAGVKGDVPLFFQPGATLFGFPGDDDSVIVTAKGAFPGTPGHPLSPLMHQDDPLENPSQEDWTEDEDAPPKAPSSDGTAPPYNLDPDPRAP